MKCLPLAPSRPEDASVIQSGWDSAVGKDFNKDLGAGLDSLITTVIIHAQPELIEHILNIVQLTVSALDKDSCTLHPNNLNAFDGTA